MLVLFFEVENGKWSVKRVRPPCSVLLKETQTGKRNLKMPAAGIHLRTGANRSLFNCLDRPMGGRYGPCPTDVIS